MTQGLSTVRTTWQGLSARERLAVSVAVWLVLLALLWSVVLAPALKVLRTAPEQHRALDQQLARQQNWRQEAERLRTSSSMTRADAVAALQNSVQSQLGPNSQITHSGDRATVSLKGVSPSALAQWLASARTGAQSKPIEAQLTQQNGNWEGSLLMQLPPSEVK